jgi:hypothetical protein
MSDRRKQLLAHAVPSSSITVAGNYTTPRTWGVYRITPDGPSKATARVRFGNHPVRQRELEAEFGVARLLALFKERAIAQDYARLLNEDDSRG